MVLKAPPAQLALRTKKAVNEVNEAHGGDVDGAGGVGGGGAGGGGAP